MGLFGPPNVEKLSEKKDVKGLIKALRYEKVFVRREAADALGNIVDSRSVDPLITALKDSDRYVRKSAVEALGKIGDSRAIDPLITALKDSDKNVRKSAVEALGKTGDSRVIDPLITALKDSEWFVRESAAEALVKIGQPAVNPLLLVLMDSDPHVRKSAVELLGKISDSKAIDPLIKVLKDSDRNVRESAAEALGKTTWKPSNDEISANYWIILKEFDKCIDIGSSAVNPLLTALKDSDPNVRKSAAEALVKIGSPAVNPLIAALKDSDKEVQKSVAEALGKIGQPAVNPLLSVLMDSDSHVRRFATEALGKIGDSKAIDPLITALNDSDRYVRESAAEALGKTTWKPSNDEISANYWIILREFNKCIAIGSPAVNPLITALKDSDKEVQESAAEALGKIGQPAVNPLLLVLMDSDPHVRKFATEALGKIGDSKAIDPLIKVLKDSDWYVREFAAEALQKLGVELEPNNPLSIQSDEYSEKYLIFQDDEKERYMSSIINERNVHPLGDAVYFACFWTDIELDKSNPDFKGLAIVLSKFGPGYRNAAWLHCGIQYQKKYYRTKSMNDLLKSIQCLVHPLKEFPFNNCSNWGVLVDLIFNPQTEFEKNIPEFEKFRSLFELKKKGDKKWDRLSFDETKKLAIDIVDIVGKPGYHFLPFKNGPRINSLIQDYQTLIKELDDQKSAKELLKTGHYIEALNAYNMVLTYDPEDASALGGKYESLYALGRNNEARIVEIQLARICTSNGWTYSPILKTTY